VAPTAARSAWTIVTRAASDRSPNDHPGNSSPGLKRHSTAEIHPGVAGPRSAHGQKGSVSRRQNGFIFPVGRHGWAFYGSGLGIGRPPLMDCQRPKRIFVICITD
jgi:hypothetical protein